MIDDNLSHANWRTSSKTQPNGSCVELATDGRAWTAVRDTKKPAGGVLVVSTASFNAFLGALKENDFRA